MIIGHVSNLKNNFLFLEIKKMFLRTILTKTLINFVIKDKNFAS